MKRFPGAIIAALAIHILSVGRLVVGLFWYWSKVTWSIPIMAAMGTLHILGVASIVYCLSWGHTFGRRFFAVMTVIVDIVCVAYGFRGNWLLLVTNGIILAVMFWTWHSFRNSDVVAKYFERTTPRMICRNSSAERCGFMK